MFPFVARVPIRSNAGNDGTKTNTTGRKTMTDAERKVKEIQTQVGIAAKALEDTRNLTGPGRLKLMVAAATVCASAVAAMESIQLADEMEANSRQIRGAVNQLSNHVKS